MKKIVVKQVFWRCSVCGTNYKKKSDAKECEGNPVEQKKFRVDDLVTNSKEPILCYRTNKNYSFNGKVVKILGPQPADEEYWKKWLGGKMPHAHVFLYEVRYTCPKCGKKEGLRCFAPELEKVK